MHLKRNVRINKLILFLLIISVVAGNYLTSFNVLGFEFYGFRIVLMISSIYLLLSKQFKCYTTHFSKRVFYVLLFWLFYGFISLIWAPDLISGIKDLFYIGIGILCYLVLFSISRDWDSFKNTLELNWNAVYILVLVFSFFEIFTKNHLSEELLENLNYLGYYHYANHVPVVTFINQNVFAIYLGITVVLGIYFFINSNRKLVNGLIVVSAIGLLLFTESRFGYFAISTYAILLLIILVKKLIAGTLKDFLTKQNVIVTSVVLVSFGLLFFATNQFLKLKSFDNCGEAKISQFDSTGNFVRFKPVDKNYLLITSNLQVDSSQLMHPNKIVVIKERILKRMYLGEQVRLAALHVGQHIDIESKIYRTQSYFLLFYWIFGILVLALVLSYILPNSSLNWKLAILVCSGFVIFALGVFTKYSLDTANSRQKDVVLVDSENYNLKPNARIVKVSLDATTANTILDNQKTTCYITQTRIAKIDQVNVKLGSNLLRKNLILNGMDYLWESHFIGVGAGGYKIFNEEKKGTRPTANLLNPHNFVIEILSQYGVIVFGALLFIGYLIFRQFYLDLVSRRMSFEHLLLTGLIICLLFLGNANSTFLSLPINWTMVALLLIVSNQLMLKQEKSDES